jgi:hypothetical protein
MALLLAAGGVAFGMAVRARLPRGNDVAQIRAMIDAGEQAVEARNVGAMMRLVSQEYRDPNGLRRDQIRFYAAQTLRDADNVQVSISEPSLRIRVEPDGQRAEVACDVSFSMTDTMGTLFPGRHFHLTMDLKKEPARVFGVFPTHAWRVVSADGYGALEGLAE